MASRKITCMTSYGSDVFSVHVSVRTNSVPVFFLLMSRPSHTVVCHLASYDNTRGGVHSFETHNFIHTYMNQYAS